MLTGPLGEETTAVGDDSNEATPTGLVAVTRIRSVWLESLVPSA